jgi:hypothetical protein
VLTLRYATRLRPEVLPPTPRGKGWGGVRQTCPSCLSHTAIAAEEREPVAVIDLCLRGDRASVASDQV